MNILFYTTFKVSPTKGGTERTTISVASGLTKIFGCHCFSLYSVDAETPKEACFESELCWENSKDGKVLLKYIVEKQIDIIIVQGAFHLIRILKETIGDINCQIIMVHHFEPGWEKNFSVLRDYIERLKSSKSFIQFSKRIIQLLLYPKYRWKYLKRLPLLYKEAYEYADKTVLLSKGFIHQYMNYANLSDCDKFYIIPNGLSYNDYFPVDLIHEKKHKVLIVSRLEDVQKRISLALLIWKRIKNRSEADGWVLNVLGHGRDLVKYRSMTEHLEIKDVFFLGRQSPKDFYKESSIFLMTSKSEGWGLTLTESQQFGVVPIAFNTYASLKDIITDGEDGFIINEGNIQMYADRLIYLIKEEAQREKIAINCINNSKRFSQEKIARMWWTLLLSVHKLN